MSEPHDSAVAAAPVVTVVVPAYEEQRRIRHCIEGLTAWLADRGEHYELLVVDDGSRDATAQVVRDYAARNPRIQLDRYDENRGKGYAVRRGLKAARGAFVFFTDADLSTPAEAIGDGLAALADADVVAGTRARTESELVVRQSLHREAMGRAFNLLARILGLTALPDTQCGFKGFRRDVLPALLEPLVVDGFAFDVELLTEAEAQGLRIVELPVRWTNHPQSRVRLVRDSVRMLLSLVAIGLRARRRRRDRRR